MKLRFIMTVTAALTLAACDVDLVIHADMAGPAVPQGSYLSFTIQPQSTVVAGVSLADVEVSIIKPTRQVAIGASVPITLSLQNNSSGGVLASHIVDMADIDMGPAGEITVTTIDGVARFSSLWVDKIGSYTLGATGDSLLLQQSQSFAVTGSTPMKLAITAQPTDATIGNAIPGRDVLTGNLTSAITVDIRDAYDNTLPGESGVVTAAFADNATNAILLGTVSIAAVDGVAQFADLRPSVPGVDYSLFFNSPALPQIRSGLFSVEKPWAANNGGLSGGVIIALAAGAPTGVFYAGTYGGVYKTATGALNWSNFSTGIDPAGLAIAGLAVDPITPTNVYAATPNGIYKTTNGALSWSAASAGLGNVDVRAIAIAPNNASLLLAATSGGMYRSTNAGATWAASSSGLADLQTRAIAFATSSPSTVFVGTTNGLFESTDGGVTWSAVGAASNLQVVSIAIDVASSNNVYIGTATGLFHSTDGGTSFPITPITTAVATVLIDPISNENIYVTTIDGMHKSTDGGGSFAVVGSGAPSAAASAAAFDIASSAKILAAFNGPGIFRSIDAGAHFLSGTAGVTQTAPRDLMKDPANPSDVYLAAYGTGIFRAVDGGHQWVPSVSGLSHFDITSIAISRATSPSTIYAGSASGGVFVSSLGVSWAQSNNGLGASLDVEALVGDPLVPLTLYAGTSTGLYRSLNGGMLWSPLSAGIGAASVTAIAIDPTNSNQLFVASTNGLWISTDGATFAQSGPLGLIRDVTLDVEDPKTIFAATPQGIYRSLDAGATFAQVGIGVTDVYAVAVDPNISSNVYAGTAVGIFKSTNGGGSWSTANIGLAPGLVRMLRPDPTSPLTIYAGTGSALSPFVGNGLYESDNGGL